MPNALRSFVYAIVSASTCSAPETAPIATHSRSCWSFCIIIMKPPPSAPSRFAAGTRQSSKNSSLVSCDAMPILWRRLPFVNPLRFASTTNIEIPRCAFFGSGSVFAATITRSHSWPFEMNVFWPFSTQSPPSLTAVVAIAARSEPVPGSVMPSAVTSSPEAQPGSQRCFCSSVPNEYRYGTMMSEWSPIANPLS